MEREILPKLLAWKNDKYHKPLILRGARQVGKTYVVKDFGGRFYENMVVLDFEKDKTLAAFFKDNLNIKHLLAELEVYYNISINPHTTLLFFDEIQQCKRALSALRYFYEEMPDIHIIAAGSLLEFSLNEHDFPVGRVQFEWLYPFTFKEYLNALGEKKLSLLIVDYTVFAEVSEPIHNLLLDHLKYYLIIGGMPEAILTYINTKSLQKVKIFQQNFVESYIQSFVKYFPKLDFNLLDIIFRQVSLSIGTKIKYSSLAPNVRNEKIKPILKILEQILLINPVYLSKAHTLPITISASLNDFKYYLFDIGVMQYLNGLSTTEILQSKNLLCTYKGMLMEQFISQQIISYNKSLENNKLFYWHRESKSSNAELDFLCTRNNAILPVEVKSGSITHLKSLHMYLDSAKDINEALVLSTNREVKTINNIKFYPVYARI